MADEKNDEKIEISKEQVEAVNKEVEAKTEEKIAQKVDEKVQEVKDEVKKSNDDLKAELAKIKEENERRALEQQILMEREKAKAQANAPIIKHEVPVSTNPTQPTETKVRELSPTEEWMAFEQATREGGMSANVQDISKLPKKN